MKTDRSAPLELATEVIEDQYGEYASVYAAVRADAAATRGAQADAATWKDVEADLELDAADEPRD